MKFLVGASLACLIAAIVWSMWGGGSEADAASQPRAAHVAAASRHPTVRDDFEPSEPAGGAPAAEEPQDAETTEEEIGDADPSLVTVRGRVVPQLGPQPENVRVTLDRDDGCETRVGDGPNEESCEHERATTVADAETGDFELQVPPGTYVIVARAEGLLPAGERGLKLTPGETVENLMLTLPPGGHVTGFVFSEGEPLGSVKVIATGEGYVRVCFTDDQGRFDLSPLPQGSFTVRAYSSGYGGDEKQARTGSSVTLDLARREKVRGRVLDAHGFPAEGVVISSDYVVTHDEVESDPWPDEPSEYYGGLEAHGCSDNCYDVATTDASGRFELQTAPGEQLVVGARRGDERAYVEGIAYGGKELELTLVPPLQARLLDADGEETSGFVQVDPPIRFWDNGVQTDERGWLSLPMSAGGTRTLILPQGTHLEGPLPAGIEVQQREVIELIY